MSIVTGYDILYPPELPQMDTQGVIDASGLGCESLIVQFRKYPGEKSGDRIIACVGENIMSGPYFISENFPCTITLTIPFSKIPDGRYRVTCKAYDYLLNESTSPSVRVKIINSPASSASPGSLHVMGARGKYGHYRYANSGSRSRVLSALDKNSRELIIAEWQYEGDADWFSGERFYDTSPSRRLLVRSGSEVITINPVNITGNGATFVAVRDNGSVVAWGDSTQGGSVPSDISKMTDIAVIVPTINTFVALSKNGRVVAWGEYYNVCNVPEDLTDVTSLCSSDFSVTALRQDYSVVTWGENNDSVPPDIRRLTDIIQVHASTLDFVALRNNHSVVGWPTAVPSEIGSRTDIVQLFTGYDGFTGLCNDGSVVSWNNGSVMNTSPVADVERVINNFYSFAALRKDGSVVAWGETDCGGCVPSAISNMKDIVDIISINNSFLALRSNGSVVSWGKYDSLPDDVSNMRDIVQIAYAYGLDAFAVLRASGHVYTWGVPGPRDEITNAQAIYTNSSAFVALTEDGQVITWGDQTGGGESSAVQQSLTHQVSYQQSP